MFTTHRPTLTLQLTLQLHKFDLFRTCGTTSFCTVARQLARFQLTRRIARSLGDGEAHCITARCYASAVLAMGLRPSVCLCLLQVGVLLKWLNVGSNKQHHTISQGRLFSDAKDLSEIRPGSPATRAPNAGGMGQNLLLLTNNRLYLEIGRR